MTTKYPRALTHEKNVQDYALCVMQMRGVLENLLETVATLPAPSQEYCDVIGIDHGTLETLLFVRSKLGECNEILTEALD